nr:hypothetical protein [Tanacetum cinerariifolium]
YVVPTGRVVVPTGRAVPAGRDVPAGKAVLAGRVVPAGRVDVCWNFINFSEKWFDFKRVYLLRYNELRVIPT